jgi:hypothetical protein
VTIDVYILDNTSDISLSLRRNAHHGVKTAITLVSVGRSVVVVNNTIELSDVGLRLRRVSGKVYLDGNDFTVGSIGFDASGIQGFILTNSEFTHYTDTAVYIHNSVLNRAIVSNTVISNNKNGVYFKSINHNAGSVNLKITSVVLEKNTVHFRLDTGSFHASDSVRMIVERCKLFGGQQALIFDGSKSGKPIVWNIATNEFTDMTGQIMRLTGTGNITSNIVRNCSYTGGLLVDIISTGTETCAVIEGNTFEECRNVWSILSFCSSCDNGRLLRNAFVNNHVINSVITCIHKSVSTTTQQFVDNVIINNTANSVPGLQAYSAALKMKWTSTIEAHDNMFSNPNLTYEVVNHQPTINSSTRIDFLDNFWGTEDEVAINSRVVDGSDAGWSPLIQRLPDPNSVQSFDTSGPLHGRLDKSLTLRRQTDPYTVSGDVIVPAGVTLTLEPGVTVALERTASLFVEGRLIARGSTESPVRFHRSEDVTQETPLRLVNGRHQREGRLEAFFGSTWRPICRTGWTTNNAHVACRQLGFGRGI